MDRGRAPGRCGGAQRLALLPGRRPDVLLHDRLDPLHGHLPATGIGYALVALIEAPVAAVAGPSFLVALPGLIAIQSSSCCPLALVAFYGTAKRLLGAGVARLGVIAWVVAPYA